MIYLYNIYNSAQQTKRQIPKKEQRNKSDAKRKNKGNRKLKTISSRVLK